MRENRIIKLASHYGGRGGFLQNLKKKTELIILPLKTVPYFTNIYFQRVFNKLQLTISTAKGVDIIFTRCKACIYSRLPLERWFRGFELNCLHARFILCFYWDISTGQFPVKDALLDINKQDSNNSRRKGGSDAHCSAVPYE